MNVLLWILFLNIGNDYSDAEVRRCINIIKLSKNKRNNRIEFDKFLSKRGFTGWTIKTAWDLFEAQHNSNNNNSINNNNSNISNNSDSIDENDDNVVLALGVIKRAAPTSIKKSTVNKFLKKKGVSMKVIEKAWVIYEQHKANGNTDTGSNLLTELMVKDLQNSQNDSHSDDDNIIEDLVTPGADGFVPKNGIFSIFFGKQYIKYIDVHLR